MKFGCCLNMVSTQPDGTGIEWIEDLAAFGYDYVELPTAQMMALDADALDALKQRLKRANIPCETSNNFFPTTMRLTGPDVDMDAIMDYVRRALTLDEELGVQYLVFGSGPAKNVPDGFPMDVGYQQVVALLKRVGSVAREHGVTIVIEPLRKAECNLINTFAEGVQLAKDVDDPNVRVLVDFYHLTEEHEPVQHLLDDGRDYLRHVHFANPTGRVFPDKADEADYAPFIAALKELDYDLHVSCEAYAPNGFRQAAPIARCFFAQQFKEE